MNITPQLILKFREHLIQTGMSKNTISEYTRQVNKLLSFIGERELSPDLLTAYRKHIGKTFNTPLSCNSNLSAVNALLRFIGREDLLITFYDIDIRKYRNRSVYSLTGSEFDKLLEVANRSKNQPAGLILRLIAHTGIRASEVGKITIESVNAGYIELIRNNISRKIIFDNHLLNDMKHYAADNKLTTGAMFLTRRSRPIARDAVWQSLHNVATLAGIDAKKASATSLREYYAKKHLEKSYDIWALSEKLGYRGISRRFDYPVSNEYERIKSLNFLYDYAEN